jgi:hypothetical protein
LDLDLLDKEELKNREKEILDRYNEILEYSKQEAENTVKTKEKPTKKEK